MRAHQTMKQDQHRQSNDTIKNPTVQSRAIGSQHDSVISNTHDTKNKEDHDRAQSSKSCAELEDVPSHRRSRSMHSRGTETHNRLFCFVLFALYGIQRSTTI